MDNSNELRVAHSREYEPELLSEPEMQSRTPGALEPYETSRGIQSAYGAQYRRGNLYHNNHGQQYRPPFAFPSLYCPLGYLSQEIAISRDYEQYANGCGSDHQRSSSDQLRATTPSHVSWTQGSSPLNNSQSNGAWYPATPDVMYNHSNRSVLIQDPWSMKGNSYQPEAVLDLQNTLALRPIQQSSLLQRLPTQQEPANMMVQPDGPWSPLNIRPDEQQTTLDKETEQYVDRLPVSNGKDNILCGYGRESLISFDDPVAKEAACFEIEVDDVEESHAAVQGDTFSCDLAPQPPEKSHPFSPLYTRGDSQDGFETTFQYRITDHDPQEVVNFHGDHAWDGEGSTRVTE
ncbi:hypothetical protein CC86DRAFT_376435 [Ophiobolus disseminans]|uniref:Uncharacterized protein n=1 Tax=Ophiobolus disseminans TaxID=1469910 RepID=A0A6A7AKM8_9PLEO|nr:hypothetical protein CC86DRAFT_376435 [Ophiobolus disseminans]